MKTILTSLCIVISMMSCKDNEKIQATNKAEQQTIKRYNVKSGKITYNTIISGKIMGGTVNGSGTETRYFKNWGATELVESKSSQTTTIKAFGKKQVKTETQHTLNKLNNGENYLVDFKNEKIYASRNTAIDLIKQLEPNSDAEKTGKKILQNIGGKEIGKEHIHGVVCDVWKIPGGKQWMYKGITLKTEVTLMGITTITEVTNIKLNLKITDNDLKLPNFPIVKQKEFISSIDFENETQEDIKTTKKELKKLKNMSFKQWKKEAQKNDEEMRQMSNEELRKIYNMMQQMIQKQQ